MVDAHGALIGLDEGDLDVEPAFGDQPGEELKTLTDRVGDMAIVQLAEQHCFDDPLTLFIALADRGRVLFGEAWGGDWAHAALTIQERTKTTSGSSHGGAGEVANTSSIVGRVGKARLVEVA
ncbi:MAG TPA: hypothetical protein VG276_14445 [Actinomycetes bacterium]|nr:hypothetical protein [Actinomycetes bacterium]